MKYLVIAEKPSVSKSIAKVIGAYRQEDGYLEGGDCVVSWCLGHLAEYAAPEHYDERYESWRFEDLPILPVEWKLLVHNTKKPQFNVLRKLLRSKKFDYVVNACDAGREGEAIFRRVYALAGSKLPIRRLWISSMEDAAIQQGFENLRDGAAYDNLFAASECRAKADWLIGMNGTRAFTKKYGRKQTIGRVQTPTLAMLAERQAKIQNFVKEPYYKVELSGAGVVAVSEQMAQEQDADAMQAACDGQCAVVGSIECKRIEKKPPKLYDLTTLQREANRYYNHPEKSDPANPVVMGGGVLLKYNARQTYTTSGFTGAAFTAICKKAGVPVQVFANRADVPGGSTLGNLLGHQILMPMVDIGLGQLAMHSAMETASCADAEYMAKAVAEYYNTPIFQPKDGEWKLGL